MQKRKLGNSNLEVSAIGLGCMGMSYGIKGSKPAQNQNRERSDRPKNSSYLRTYSYCCSEGVLNIFHEKSADNYKDAGAVKTEPSTRTMALDQKTKKIFLSAAEYVETPATTPGGRP